MVILPRLARRLNSPAIATALAVILIAVGIFGIATDDIRTWWAVLVMVVGVINLIRAIPYGGSEADQHPQGREPA
jgi:isoprenylcysteine carboxyl methyltransferase (ICMT) family protein YpbQ